ncbi:hypothetical protein BgiMline_015837 [Biomphalaria glabrata]
MEHFSKLNQIEIVDMVEPPKVQDAVDNLHFLHQPNGNVPSDAETLLVDDINKNVRLEGESVPSDLNALISPCHSNTNQKAILLGRGNSFSLGRSEAIIINSNRKSWQVKETNRNNNCVGDFNTTHGFAPPPISILVTNGTDVVSQTTSGQSFDELEKLWHKVESIMLAKQEVVQQVLEESGIGEAGEEDEDVWQVLQENFQV